MANKVKNLRNNIKIKAKILLVDAERLTDESDEHVIAGDLRVDAKLLRLVHFTRHQMWPTSISVAT